MGTGHLKIHSTNITPDALICPNDKPVVSSSVVPSVLATVRPTSNVYTGAALIILLLFLAIPATESQKTHRLFWDDKNPVFNYGNNRMFVEEGDDITIICPQNSHEFNNIYWTNKKDAYDICDFSFDQNAIKLITCDPNHSKLFNFQVTRYSWVSLNPTFEPEKPVYLLSQSNHCSRFNMKIAIILKSNEPENKEILKGVASPERVVQPKSCAPINPSVHLSISISLVLLILMR